MQPSQSGGANEAARNPGSNPGSNPGNDVNRMSGGYGGDLAGIGSPGPMSAATAATVMQVCIQTCHQCHDVCLHMALVRCLDLGGKHVCPEHLRLLLNCAEICRVATHFMGSASSLSDEVCGVCANVCEACARSCAEVGGLDDCIDVCTKCARECRQIMATLDLGAADG